MDHVRDEAWGQDGPWPEPEPGPGPETGTPVTGASARPAPSRARRAGRGVRRGATSTARVTGRASRSAARVTGRAGRSAYRLARRASHAEGAGETGLARLIEVHAFHNAGDAAVAVALAGSLFFQVPSGEARGQVALFLLLTMLPFVIVAPLVGPFLDRFRHGRRWAIGATCAARAFLCWVLAGSVTEASWWQFPAALGVLVSSKAYSVTRSAATPRLLPERLNLVKANSRMSLAGVVGAAIAAPLAAGFSAFGAEWGLRFAFVVFVLGTILAILLPPAVDSAAGEQDVSMRDVAAPTPRGRRRYAVPAPVVTALRANVGLRVLSGFLTIFMAFLLRDQPFPGWEDRGTLLLAVVVGAAGVGSAVGTVLGSLLKSRSPQVIVLAVLVLDAVAAVCAALFFGLMMVLVLALTVGLCQQLGKLALDALIQERVREEVRTSVFGRSETLIQLSWVVGGGLAVVLPTDATLGMWVVAGLLVLWLGLVLYLRAGGKPSRERPAPDDDRVGRTAPTVPMDAPAEDNSHRP